MIIYVIIASVAVLAVIFALIALFRYLPLGREAAENYVVNRREGLLESRVSEADYISAYKKAYTPRGPLYAMLVLAINAALTLPALGLMNFLFEFAWRLGGQDRTFEPGYLVWHFMLYMGLIICWSAISFLILRRYHKNHPSTLQQLLKA